MTPLPEGSSAAVVQAIEANLYSFGITQFGKWSRIDVYDEPHLLWFECDMPSPMFNVAHRARLSRENVEEAIKTVKEHYARRDLPFVWWVDPSSTPLTLSKHLTAAGFLPAGEMTGMAIDLTQNIEPEQVDEKRGSAELEVRPTTDEDSLAVFAHTMCAGFEMKEEIKGPIVELSLAMGYGAEGPLINYVGYSEGRAVATSSLFVDGDTAGIYNVATVPEARRQGFGTKITLAPLREAARQGCKLAVLHASAMAVPMYRRLRFDSYCYFHLYIWPPGS
ncbi:MAG: GNAT family N-acetyltransferase [Candidatus Promineifilaceae bacterium]|jgi:ribosomal protein S18 acetylase RimI-like enzyme